VVLIVINAQLILAIILGLTIPGVFIFGLLFAVLMAVINFIKPPEKVQIRASDAIF
jgi:hypothetical protein